MSLLCARIHCCCRTSSIAALCSRLCCVGLADMAHRVQPNASLAEASRLNTQRPNPLEHRSAAASSMRGKLARISVTHPATAVPSSPISSTVPPSLCHPLQHMSRKLEAQHAVLSAPAPPLTTLSFAHGFDTPLPLVNTMCVSCLAHADRHCHVWPSQNSPCHSLRCPSLRHAASGGPFLCQASVCPCHDHAAAHMCHAQTV